MVIRTSKKWQVLFHAPKIRSDDQQSVSAAFVFVRGIRFLLGKPPFSSEIDDRNSQINEIKKEDKAIGAKTDLLQCIVPERDKKTNRNGNNQVPVQVSIDGKYSPQFVGFKYR